MNWLTSWDAELRRLFPTMTRTQLAEHFGVSRRTVNTRCRELGLVCSDPGRRRQPPGWDEIDPEDVMNMLMLGWSVRRISRETGRSRNYLDKVIKGLSRGMRRRAKNNWRCRT